MSMRFLPIPSNNGLIVVKVGLPIIFGISFPSPQIYLYTIWLIYQRWGLVSSNSFLFVLIFFLCRHARFLFAHEIILRLLLFWSLFALFYAYTLVSFLLFVTITSQPFGICAIFVIFSRHENENTFNWYIKTSYAQLQ